MPLPWWDVEDLLDDVDLEPNDRTYKLGNLCQRNLRAIRPSNCARRLPLLRNTWAAS
jgi:hypothetical protein